MFKKHLSAAMAVSLLMSVGVAMAEAPTSQFGFKGWPYRQQTSCGTQAPQPTQAPAATDFPAPAETPSENGPDMVVIPTQSPTAPTSAPTAALTQEPVPTQAPQWTQQPTMIPTAQPIAVPTVRPTARPTAVPTARPTAAPTVRPTATKAPSSEEDYTTVSVSMQEQTAWNLMNQDRIANGLSALPLDAELCRLARLKSEDMRNNNYFAHESPTYGRAADMLKAFGYSYKAVGENIAHHATVEKSEAAFMSSDGHRRNILSSSWAKVGIGVAIDRNGFVYLTQLFVR